jgi:periplasmic protein TonB
MRLSSLSQIQENVFPNAHGNTNQYKSNQLPNHPTHCAVQNQIIMDNHLVLNNSFNEMVFENRNKEYGAYQIRNKYNRNVLVAGIFSSLIALSAVGFSLFTQENNTAILPPKESPHIVSIVPVNLPKDEDKPKEDKPAVKPHTVMQPKLGMSPNSTPQIVASAKPVSTIPADSIGTPGGVVGGSGSGPLQDTTGQPCLDCPPTTPEPPIIVTWASQPPVFDVDAFFKRNMRYPQMAKDQNIQGTVYLSWVVDENGNVEDVKLVKGANRLLDKEAVRVAEMMPQWAPAEHEGRRVKFLFQKAVKFVLQ